MFPFQKHFSYVVVDMNIPDSGLKKVVYFGLTNDVERRKSEHFGSTKSGSFLYKYREKNAHCHLEMIVVAEFENILGAALDGFCLVWVLI